MKTEKIFRTEKVPHKLIPVPKYLSSDCGVCIRVGEDELDLVKKLLDGKVDYTGITSLING